MMISKTEVLYKWGGRYIIRNNVVVFLLHTLIHFHYIPIDTYLYFIRVLNVYIHFAYFRCNVNNASQMYRISKSTTDQCCLVILKLKVVLL